MIKSPQNRPKWLLPFILIAIIISIVGVYVVYNSLITPLPSSVTLTGTVTSANGLKVPELITFISLSSGSKFESYVSGGMSGTYAVTLPNENSYKVTVTWASKGDGGTADLGTLNLNSNEAAFERNWVG